MSRLLPYKNVDVVVDAVRGTEHRLVVVGAGPGRDALLDTMPGNVRLLSGLTDAQLRWVYAHSRILVAPSFEDYGLSPLEAAVFGRPSLTLRAGGYLDTVREGVTGLHVDAPDPALFRAGLAAADAHPWDAAVLRAHAERFAEAGLRRPVARRGRRPPAHPLSGRRRPAAEPSGRPPNVPIGRTARIGSGLSRPPVGDPGHARYWVGATPFPITRGRPPDARHDVAKVP